MMWIAGASLGVEATSFPSTMNEIAPTIRNVLMNKGNNIAPNDSPIMYNALNRLINFLNKKFRCGKLTLHSTTYFVSPVDDRCMFHSDTNPLR